jgi:hypothetical protein
MEIGPTMAHRITWNGTAEEALALLQALQTHCECRVHAGRTIGSCASHTMLAHDQRAVDGLLFMRHMAPRLLAAEFDLTAAPAAGSASA